MINQKVLTFKKPRNVSIKCSSGKNEIILKNSKNSKSVELPFSWKKKLHKDNVIDILP